MSINFRKAAVRVLTAAGLSLAVSSVAFAAPGLPSLAINFAADEPVLNPVGPGSPVNGAAGVLGTANWNNLTTLSGTNSSLTADVLGVATPIPGTSITWSSNNTWASTGRGEENNTAPAGENRDLMTGYLDTGGLGGTGVTITMANLPPVQGLPLYDVYVYIKGGVNGRGGSYTIGGTTLNHTSDAAFNGTFVEDVAEPGTTPGSNYIVFRGLSASGFTLTSTPLVGDPARAPINAIEIVAVPEPGTVALFGIGAIIVSAGVYLRRRNSG